MPVSSDGTIYRTESESLMVQLDRLRRDRVRVKIIYDGDWGRSARNFDTGYIGRSMGNPKSPGGGMKIPLLIHNRRSSGGFPLADSHIIRIEHSRGGALIWDRELHG